MRLCMAMIVAAGVAASAHAATPEQVGTWKGTFTGKSYVQDQEQPLKTKFAATLVINQDDTYSIAIGDVINWSGTGYFDAFKGALPYNVVIDHFNTTVHFKGTSLKGNVLGISNNAAGSLEGKLALKKVVQ